MAMVQTFEVISNKFLVVEIKHRSNH